tara:strand:- start:36 stop:1124 length:1089 start_codon:yes stop_codon:yes gene_type:complete
MHKVTTNLPANLRAKLANNTFSKPSSIDLNIAKNLDDRSSDQVSGGKRLEERGCLDFFAGFMNFFHRPPIERVSEAAFDSSESFVSQASTADTEGVEGPDSLEDNYADNLENQEVSLEDLDKTVYEHIKKIYAIKQHDGSNFGKIFEEGKSSKVVSNALGDLVEITKNISHISRQIIECDEDYKVGKSKITYLNQASYVTSHIEKKIEYDAQKATINLVLKEIKEDKNKCLNNMQEVVERFREISLKDSSVYGKYALNYIHKFTEYLYDLKNGLDENLTSFNDELDQIKRPLLELAMILKEKYKQVEKQVVSLYEKEKKEYDSMLAKQLAESFTHKQDEPAAYSLPKSISCPNFSRNRIDFK